MDDIQGKHVDLSLSRPDMLYRFAHALASPVRIRIMQELGARNMNVGELSQELDIPMSTTALAVKTLEEAGLITTSMQPGSRGSMKLCSRRLDNIFINLEPEGETPSSTLVLQMPVGGYSIAEGIRPTCGLASDKMNISGMDNPAVFYSPDRFEAQLLWMRQGALEYRFSYAFKQHQGIEIDWIELSFEACSEAVLYRDPWKSDIVVSVNGKRLGIWTSPCDCGGRRGRLTPEWWPELSSQFGFLKTWRVNHDGSYLDNSRISDTKIEDLDLEGQEYIAVRIEVPADAQNVGGLNLFGERFGDHPQAIVLTIGYHMKSEDKLPPEML